MEEKLSKMDLEEQIGEYKVKHMKLNVDCSKDEDLVFVLRVPKDYDYISLKVTKNSGE